MAPQLDLFGVEAGSPDTRRPAKSGPVLPAPAPAELAALAERLPKNLHFGTSSWAYPGWSGLVYDRPYPQQRLSREGLSAYAQHPLLRAVGIDRSYYAPPRRDEFAAYA